MKMIFCVVLIIAAVCIAALVCYVVSGKVLQEKNQRKRYQESRSCKKEQTLARKSRKAVQGKTQK